MSYVLVEPFLNDDLPALILDSCPARKISIGHHHVPDDRTGHDQAVIDRLMRLAAAAMVVAGVLQLPVL